MISLRSDSHTVIAEQAVTLEEQVYKTDSATGNELANRFDDMTQYMKDNCENLSRADFAGTWPEAAADKTAAECGITLEEYNYADHLGDEAMPTTGANNGISLIDLRGKAYDDEMWDQLLDELTVDDMTTMLNDCAYNTPAIAHIGKPATSEPDGRPASPRSPAPRATARTAPSSSWPRPGTPSSCTAPARWSARRRWPRATTAGTRRP